MFNITCKTCFAYVKGLVSTKVIHITGIVLPSKHTHTHTYTRIEYD